MVTECKYGQMVQNTKESGLTINHVGRESFSILMVICTRGNGVETKPMVLGSTHIQMGLSLKEMYNFN